MYDWDDLRIFLATARAGSMLAAASELGVNQTTVARRIAALESSLRVRLFNRNRDGCRLSEAGANLLAQAERVADEAETFERLVAQGSRQLSGVIRVTASDGTASYLVDISNGGGLIMRENRLQKGPLSDNPNVAVTLAAEGNSNPSAEITIENNTFTNDLAASTLFVLNGTVTAATLTGNRLTGRVTALQGPGTVDTGFSLPISQGR